jgi:A/G-specific adenine glycosylase
MVAPKKRRSQGEVHRGEVHRGEVHRGEVQAEDGMDGAAKAGAIAPALLAWYDAHARVLPWRARPADAVDPYRVWLSEIMLQQTSVTAAAPYFLRFLKLWPRVEDLAAAPNEDIMREWAGLGYYARARNLHACAKAVVERFGGRFPETEESLKTLPGVGDYTAAAVAAIAFGRKATVVDGNVERVVARLFAVEAPLPASKPELKRLAATLTPDARAGDFAQAMMDLGATVCIPKSPRCMLCPLAGFCTGRARGIAAALPRRAPKGEQRVRIGVAFWLVNGKGEVLLRRRPPKGLLGGMMEVPSSDWVAKDGADIDALAAHAPAPAKWKRLGGIVAHTFTHFHLELSVAVAVKKTGWETIEGRWVAPEDLGGQALPSLMRKVVEHALNALD